MPRNDPDSLDRDVTRSGKPDSPDANDTSGSLGQEPTLGGVGSSAGGTDGVRPQAPRVVSGRYQIETVAGKGGMGKVWLAFDTQLKRKVAIKRLQGELGTRPQTLQRFAVEAQAIAALNHFNIVQIYDYGRDQDGPFIIMEYVEGQSLQDKLREGPLELAAAVEITCQLCDGLSVAHEAGIIHRDIKPGNILLTQRGEPKLTDFGLARRDAVDHGQTQLGAVLGTIDFMPPEQRRDATKTDARSDLWSLAATFYQMVTGRSPKVIRLDLVAASLRPVLAKALEDVPDDRYRTAEEFRDALRSAMQAAGSPQLLEIDLAAGECPGCHTRNEASRRFCRECAAPLRVPCLACELEIPIWEKVCGECGAKQLDLAEARHAALEDAKQQAETLCSVFRYDEASEVLATLMEERHPRFQVLREWATDFATSIETQKARQEEDAKSKYLQAQEYESACDYASGIQTLQSIPEPMRTTSMEELLSTLQAREQEWKDLERTVQAGLQNEDWPTRLENEDLLGLLAQVDRMLQLRPGLSDAVEVKNQLEHQLQQQRIEKLKTQLSVEKDLCRRLKLVQAYRQQYHHDDWAIELEQQLTAKLNREFSEKVARAHESFDSYKDRDTLKILSSLAYRKDDEVVQSLLARTEERLARVAELRSAIQSTKNSADRLALVQEYRSLRPHDESAEQLERKLSWESTCFFCGVRTAEDDASVEHRMHGQVRTAAISGGRQELRWKTIAVSVPRCAECRMHHTKQQEHEERAGCCGCLIVVLIVGWGVFYFFNDGPPWYSGDINNDGLVIKFLSGLLGAICSLFLALPVFLVVSWLMDVIRKPQTPYPMKKRSDISAYGRIEELRCQGWKDGEKPSDDYNGPRKLDHRIR